MILNIYKPIGITPLKAIEVFRARNPEYKDEKMTYAGRLDPLAEGVLVVLTGKDVYKKEQYLKLDKEYEAEIIFGFKTDTGDILGIPSKTERAPILKNDIESELKKIKGEITLSLPAYSSYKVRGKPLFWWAREKRLGEIEIPKRKIKIYEADLLGLRIISVSELLASIECRVGLVEGDFRQEKIIARWRDILSGDGARDFTVAKIKIKCSSGTYIRSIARELGRRLGAGAILADLKRTKAGKFDVQYSARLSYTGNNGKEKENS